MHTYDIEIISVNWNWNFLPKTTTVWHTCSDADTDLSLDDGDDVEDCCILLIVKPKKSLSYAYFLLFEYTYLDSI